MRIIVASCGACEHSPNEVRRTCKLILVTEPALYRYEQPDPAAIQSLLESYKPSSTALFDWLRPRVTDEMLLDIATHDGGYSISKHFSALKRVRDSGEVPRPLKWEPLEVLRLTRWSEIAICASEALPSGIRIEHLNRLFCCTALLRAMDQPHTPGENDVLAPFVESAIAIAECKVQAEQFLAWFLLSITQEESEQPYSRAAMLLLRIGSKDDTQAEVRLLLNWLLEDNFGPATKSLLTIPEWLLAVSNYDQRRTMWRHLVSSIVTERARIADEFQPVFLAIIERVNDAQWWRRWQI
jgi:hypothetical protein